MRGGSNWDSLFFCLRLKGETLMMIFFKAEGANFDDDFFKAEGANFEKKRAARVRGCAAGINGTLLRNERKHCDGHHFFFF